MVRFRVSSLVILALAASASADIRLGSLFGDHMVLQRGLETPIFGTATPNASITVTLDGKRAGTGTSDAQGAFKVKLPRLDAPGPYTITVSDGTDTTTLNDVLAGDVWLCSGQSNMEFSVVRGNNAEAEIAAANFPNIRLVTIKRNAQEDPVEDVDADWMPATPESVRPFSAVAYFFGRKIHQEVGVPIGLVHSSWGGTYAESWTPLPVLGSLKGLKNVEHDYARRKYYLSVQVDPATQPTTTAASTAMTASPTTNSSTRPTSRPAGVPPKHNVHATLYNGMIQPLGSFALKGAIWYQGESNAGRAAEYQTVLTAMIGAWREQFGVGDFPFYMVGLANFQDRITDPNGLVGWAPIRAAQYALDRDVKNVATTVTIDIGETKDIHPKDKQDVGLRLALLALDETYGKTLVSQGPTFKKARFDGPKVTIEFDHVGGGLKQQGDALDWFSIAGADGVFVWADAKIVGDTVVLSSDKVPEPTVARYAWASNPRASLFNAENLPAAPFEVKK